MRTYVEGCAAPPPPFCFPAPSPSTRTLRVARSMLTHEQYMKRESPPQLICGRPATTLNRSFTLSGRLSGAAESDSMRGSVRLFTLARSDSGGHAACGPSTAVLRPRPTHGESQPSTMYDSLPNRMISAWPIPVSLFSLEVKGAAWLAQSPEKCTARPL